MIVIPASIGSLGAETHVTGDNVRAVISATRQDPMIDALRRDRIRMISITPLRTSLETYFVEKLQRFDSAEGESTEEKTRGTTA